MVKGSTLFWLTISKRNDAFRAVATFDTGTKYFDLEITVENDEVGDVLIDPDPGGRLADAIFAAVDLIPVDLLT